MFRYEFLATLGHLETTRWPLAPSHGQVHLRFPCPACGWAEKRAERTRLVAAGSGGADFAAVCTDHGDYEATITPDSHAYLDLATLYRNLVKERVAARDAVTLSVMIKAATGRSAANSSTKPSPNCPASHRRRASSPPWC